MLLLLCCDYAFPLTDRKSVNQLNWTTWTIAVHSFAATDLRSTCAIHIYLEQRPYRDGNIAALRDKWLEKVAENGP